MPAQPTTFEHSVQTSAEWPDHLSAALHELHDVLAVLPAPLRTLCTPERDG